jgi:hypothetical protein
VSETAASDLMEFIALIAAPLAVAAGAAVFGLLLMMLVFVWVLALFDKA